MRGKHILVMAAAMLAAISVFGQPAAVAASKGQPAGQAQKSKQRGDAIAKALNLTKDQMARIQKVNQDAQKQITALKADKKMSQAQKKTKLRTIVITSNQKCMAVLTPVQRKKLQQMQEQARKKAGAKK